MVALHPEDRELVELQIAVAKLEAANAKLRAVIRLLLALVPVLVDRRVRAQVDVTFSNSMVENLWHQAKHRRLDLHQLDSIDSLRRLFGKFVDDHNWLIPRVALGGRTPDEVFFGRELDVAAKLAEAKALARAERVLTNRVTPSCGGCDGPVGSTPREEVVDCR